MKHSPLEILKSTYLASRFTQFIDGVDLSLPTGKTVTLKIFDTKKSIRPVGLRLSQYSFVTTLTNGSQKGFGYGEGSNELIALQKSISEGVERVVFKSLCETKFGTSNSNGWAAHINGKLAQENAQHELLERDAILTHWLCLKPMLELSPQTFPKWLNKWVRHELALGADFNRLRILVSTEGLLPAVMTVLEGKDSRSVMSHAVADTLEKGIYKALVETCRIAQIALEGRFVETSKNLLPKVSPNAEKISPEDHAMVYAHHLDFPKWIFGTLNNWKELSSYWKTSYRKYLAAGIHFKFNEITQGPLSVGFCESNKVQNLFFGRTETALLKGIINFNRLKNVMTSDKINLMPHCVP